MLSVSVVPYGCFGSPDIESHFNPKEICIGQVRNFDSSKNEVSVESLEAPFGRVGRGIEGVSDVERTGAVAECLPEVDDEVLIAFECGDPSRPSRIASLVAVASGTSALVLMADMGGQFAHANATGEGGRNE